MIEKDYVMRLIHEIIRTLILLLFQKDIDEGTVYEFNEMQSQELERLKRLIDAGKIGDAEDQLWEGIEEENGTNFEMSLMFYEYLNEKSNDFLEEHQFSRKEIIEGIRYVSSCYGYGGMAEPLLENVAEEE